MPHAELITPQNVDLWVPSTAAAQQSAGLMIIGVLSANQAQAADRLSPQEISLLPRSIQQSLRLTSAYSGELRAAEREVDRHAPAREVAELAIKNLAGQDVRAADDSEIHKYTHATTEPHTITQFPEANLSEINLAQFITTVLNRKHGRLNPLASEVLDHLTAIVKIKDPDLAGHYSLEAVMSKDGTPKTYYDRKTDSRQELATKEPGELERVALSVAEMIESPELALRIRASLVESLFGTVKAYRLHTVYARYMPEMPWLSEKLIEAAGSFRLEDGHEAQLDKELRYRIYDTLAQLPLPHEQQQRLIKFMDIQGDLTHPLAFDITVRLSSHTDDPWTLEQARRRNSAIEALDGSPQQIFDNYDALVKATGGIVTSVDPNNMPERLVGIETEFIDPIYSDPEVRRLQVSRSLGDIVEFDRRDRERAGQFNVSHRPPASRWAVPHWEVFPNLETKLVDNKEALTFDRGYLAALAAHGAWLSDVTPATSSIHLHLNRAEHPYVPALGYLLVEAPLIHIATMEVRAMTVPLYKNSISPARIADMVHLFTLDAQAQEELISPVETTTELHPWQQLAFGQIAAFVKDPQARLAALMCLSHELPLRAFDPYAFAFGYTESSRQTIARSIAHLGQQSSRMDGVGNVTFNRRLRQLTGSARATGEQSQAIDEYYVALNGHNPLEKREALATVTALSGEEQALDFSISALWQLLQRDDQELSLVDWPTQITIVRDNLARSKRSRMVMRRLTGARSDRLSNAAIEALCDYYAQIREPEANDRRDRDELRDDLLISIQLRDYRTQMDAINLLLPQWEGDTDILGALQMAAYTAAKLADGELHGCDYTAMFEALGNHLGKPNGLVATFRHVIKTARSEHVREVAKHVFASYKARRTSAAPRKVDR